MKNDWIIDVLADLNNFAKTNGLPALAKQLEETALVASVELASNGVGALQVDARSRTDCGSERTGDRPSP